MLSLSLFLSFHFILPPRHIDGRGKDIFEESRFHLGHIFEPVVDFSTFGDQTLSNFLGKFLRQLGSDAVGIGRSILEREREEKQT